MHFFSKWFDNNAHKDQPKISFGRFSDTYKGPDQYRAWDESQIKFQEGDVIGAAKHFFSYLKDPDQNNVKLEEGSEGEMKFTIYQGSKTVMGVLTRDKIRAEALIAEVKELKLGFARKLLEQNFALKHCRFTLTTDHKICLVFDSNVKDLSAYKLYYGLKELCLESDKKDDLLIDEFRTLMPVNTLHIKPLSQSLIEKQYQYLQNNLINVSNLYRDSYDRLGKVESGIRYIILDLIYKLDYLLKPEGYIMEKLEKIHFLYFTSDNSNSGFKDEKAHQLLQSIKDRSLNDFRKEQYDVLSTFGNATPIKYETIADLFHGQIQNIDWYLSQKKEVLVQALCGYLIGFSLFSYAPPLPLKQLFHLYYAIIESDYFNNIGFVYDFNNRSKGLRRSRIIKAIKKIETQNSDSFPRLNFNTQILDFKTLPRFSASMIKLILNLDLYEKPQ